MLNCSENVSETLWNREQIVDATLPACYWLLSSNVTSPLVGTSIDRGVVATSL